MQPSIKESKKIPEGITYLVGNSSNLKNIQDLPSKVMFDEEMLSFLADLSSDLMKDSGAKGFSDVISYVLE